MDLLGTKGVLNNNRSINNTSKKFEPEKKQLWEQ